MNIPADGAAPAPPAAPASRRNRVAVIAVVLAVAAAAVVAVALWPSAPAEPLRLTVSLSPASPGPHERFAVIAQVDGGTPSRTDVSIAYDAYGNASAGGGGSPLRTGNRWTQELPGFPDGSEVWIIVAAATPDQPPLFEHRTVSIGTVVHGGPSGIVIEGVVRTPEQPDPLDDVRVSARVTSAANVTRVFLLAHHYRWTFEAFGTSFSGGGGGGGPMWEGVPGDYSASLGGVPAPGMSGFERGTIWVYRIVAWDGTGSIAVTSVETFTVL